jgi:hypothetical protein
LIHTQIKRISPTGAATPANPASIHTLRKGSITITAATVNGRVIAAKTVTACRGDWRAFFPFEQRKAREQRAHETGE